MKGASLRAAASWRPLALAWVVLAGGCTQSEPLERAGVSLDAPADWRPVPRATWPVPGTPLAAWSVPGGASLVVYQALPVPAGDPARYADGEANRLENLPGMTILRRGTASVAGSVAADFEVRAAGTGDAFAGIGRGTPVAVAGKTLQPTRRRVLAFLRDTDTLAIVWHAPEAEADALAPRLESALRSLTIRRGTLRTQSY